jgi:outer membrane protein TolC
MNTIGKGTFLLFLILAGICGNSYAQAQEPISLTLDKALEIAMSENPTIKIADRDIEKQKYSKKEVQGTLYPTIDATAGYDRSVKIGVVSIGGQSFSMGTDNTYNAGIVMGMPLFNMGLYKAIQLSDVTIKMALESARASKLSLKNEVQKAYYLSLLAQDIYSVMQMSMDNAQKSYRDAKNKYDQGLAAEYDLIRAEVRVSNIKPNLIDAENGIKMAELQLKMLLGMPLEERIKAVGNLVDYESEYESFGSLYAYNLDENTTLKQMDIQSQLLEKQLQVQKASYLPTLNMSFNYLYRSMGDGAPFSKFDWTPSSTLSFSLNVPIFNGFIRKNKVAQVRTDMEALRLQRDYTESGLNVQVKNSLIAMQNAIEQLESNKEGVRSAEKAFTIAQARYNSGMGTLLELNDSEIALTQARLNYNQSIYNYMAAKSDYELLLGQDY